MKLVGETPEECDRLTEAAYRRAMKKEGVNQPVCFECGNPVSFGGYLCNDCSKED